MNGKRTIELFFGVGCLVASSAEGYAAWQNKKAAEHARNVELPQLEAYIPQLGAVIASSQPTQEELDQVALSGQEILFVSQNHWIGKYDAFSRLDDLTHFSSLYHPEDPLHVTYVKGILGNVAIDFHKMNQEVQKHTQFTGRTDMVLAGLYGFAGLYLLLYPLLRKEEKK
jgi:hypothetical protein